MSRAIWTIGHSNHSFDRVAELLMRERVEFLVDVRSYPYSRITPQFNREYLEPATQERGMRYLYLGEELGGRPSKTEHYDDEGRALYGPMSEEPAFRRARDRLLDGSKTSRIALLCSEGYPDDCHRRLLVGKVLTEQGVELRHILPDGSMRVERDVPLGTDDQGALFRTGDATWRSIRSVSHRRRLRASSVG